MRYVYVAPFGNPALLTLRVGDETDIRPDTYHFGGSGIRQALLGVPQAEQQDRHAHTEAYQSRSNLASRPNPRAVLIHNDW